MFFRYVLKTGLPRLAWVAHVRRHHPEVRVAHGAWLELRDAAFVEGAWDAPFTDFAFDGATMLVGSGGRSGSGGVVFAGHSDLHERLYLVRRDGELYVSPSLALLLAASGESLDPREPHYYLTFVDAYRDGLRRPRKRIPLAGGREVEMHNVCNLHVAPDLTVTRIEKTWPAPPRDFGSYVSLLQGTLGRVLTNAADPSRLQAFRPVVTISRGYDSVAVAALASRAGCREAVTFRESGSAHGVANDDGSEIGRVLGYATSTYDRPERSGGEGSGADEFYLEPWGVDRDVAPMEAQLVGAILLTGRSTSGWQTGEGARWGLPGNSGLPLLQRPVSYTPGCALTDFRMRVGFLHFAVPAIAAIHAAAVHRITESGAMRPWRLGGSYDKPIPRRIAEEASVPRHMFGTTKHGGRKKPPRGRSLRARVAAWRARVGYWGPMRVLIRSVLGNRLHPRWRIGSFEVQRGAAAVAGRYRRALDD